MRLLRRSRGQRRKRRRRAGRRALQEWGGRRAAVSIRAGHPATIASVAPDWRCRSVSALVMRSQQACAVRHLPACSPFGVVMAVAANAQQALLEIAIGRERLRCDYAVNPPVDHDDHGVGHPGGNVDVLLNDKDRDVASSGEAHECFLDMRDDDGGEALCRLVHDQQAGDSSGARG